MRHTTQRAIWLVAVCCICLAGCGQKSLQVSDAWARPAAAGDNGAVYFTIDNPLKEADTLLSVQCEAAGQAELHMSKMEDGVMTMEAQKNVPVAAESQVQFAPGGLHVMLVGLKKDLAVGDHFDLNLYFDRAGAVTVTAEVKEQE